MTKKILISLSIISIVAAIAVGGTIAYFSDTETSTGNTFSTGVIDIWIDGQNPWTESWDIVDMKPCETGYINFVIHNPGNNPLNVWKKIKNITTDDGIITEPECVYGEGVWDGVSQACDILNANPPWEYKPKHNLHNWMYYDLSVRVPILDNKDGAWWQTIYEDSDEVTIGSVENKRIFLGMVPAGKTMEVTQSYHLSPGTGNWAQADTMTFDIEIYAEQLTGSLILENKTNDWQILGTDDIKATLTYNMTSPTFDYSLIGKVLLKNTQYSLIYYADPWPGDGEDHNGTGVLIGKGTSLSDGAIDFIGSTELNRDLPKWPSDQNHPEGAKIWLVPSDHYSATVAGAQGYMMGWSPSSYLFETALMTYDDTDI